jgi:alpha-mannosidase
VINSGQHGLDFADGEIRLSVLRSAAYCHEQGLPIPDPPAHKYMDQGVHEFRILVTAGDTEDVRRRVTGLADWLAAPPAVYAHLPIGTVRRKGNDDVTGSHCEEFLSLTPQNIRLTACRPAEGGRGLLLRFHETSGIATKALLRISQPALVARLSFHPFAIKTILLGRTGRWREVHLVEEQ